MEEIIDGELSCNDCVEKTRCQQQQKTKKQRIDAILSYITNEDNKKYIAELKNEIPVITRCDVILEKQLKRLEQENAKLKEDVKEAQEAYNFKRIHCEVYQADNMKLRKALGKIKSKCQLYIDDKQDLTPEQVINIINEVLKDE